MSVLPIAKILTVSSTALLLVVIAHYTLSAQPSKQASALELRYNPRLGDRINWLLDGRVTQSFASPEIEISLGADLSQALVVGPKVASGWSLSQKTESNLVRFRGLPIAGIPDTSLSLATIETRMWKLSNKQVVEVEAPLIESKGDMLQAIANGIATWLHSASAVFFPSYPLTSVLEGATWQGEARAISGGLRNKDKSNGGMMINYILKTVVDTLGRKCALIGFEADSLRMQQKASQMGIDVEIEGEGIAKGEVLCDATTGYPIRGNVSAQIDASGQTSDADAGAFGFTVNLVLAMTRPNIVLEEAVAPKTQTPATQQNKPKTTTQKKRK